MVKSVQHLNREAETAFKQTSRNLAPRRQGLDKTLDIVWWFCDVVMASDIRKAKHERYCGKKRVCKLMVFDLTLIFFFSETQKNISACDEVQSHTKHHRHVCLQALIAIC